MCARNMIAVFLLLPLTAFAQNDGQDDLLQLRSELVQQLEQTDVSKFTLADSITFHLAVSEVFHSAKLKEQANAYFQKSVQLAETGDKQKHLHQLFKHALKIEDLKAAAEFAAAIPRNERYLNQLAVEKYRLGDQKALKDFPYGELDFYNALDLANAYAERREYDKLEAFVRGIDKLPNNEPTDVGAIVWERIAVEYRQQGKMEEAKKFIDKAKQIGGNNYYTGFSIRAAHLAIHGGLKEQAVKFAQRAVAYRGHFTRELLSSLIGELLAAGHDDTAVAMLDYYPTEEERLSAEKYVALHLAEHGKFQRAIKTATELKDAKQSAGAQVFVAQELLKVGKAQQAKSLVAGNAVTLVKDAQSEYFTNILIKLLAQLNQREPLLGIIKAGKTPLQQSLRLVAAIEGTHQPHR